MSDNPTQQQTTDPAPAASDAPAGDPPKADAPAPNGEQPLGEAGVKALQTERESRKAAEKEAAALKARIKEFEDRDKTEAERTAEQLAEARKQAENATREALRYRLAARFGITDEDAETFLTGSDEESMTRQAERLTQLRGEAKPAVPKPDPSQGARPEGSPDIDQQIRDAQAKGDTRLVISLQNQKLIQQAKK